MIQYKLLLLNNLGVFTVFVIRCVRTKNLRLEVSFLYSNRYFTRQWTKKILSTLMCAWALYATKYIYFFIASYQRVQRELILFQIFEALFAQWMNSTPRLISLPQPTITRFCLRNDGLVFYIYIFLIFSIYTFSILLTE